MKSPDPTKRFHEYICSLKWKQCINQISYSYWQKRKIIKKYLFRCLDPTIKELFSTLLYISKYLFLLPINYSQQTGVWEIYQCISLNFFLTHLFFSSSSLLSFRRNFGISCCSRSFTPSLSAIAADRPLGLMKWNVFAPPSCNTNWSWTFSFESGEIFCAEKRGQVCFWHNLWPFSVLNILNFDTIYSILIHFIFQIFLSGNIWSTFGSSQI